MTHAFLIGIGGSGLSAIARLLIEKGYQVSGSDLEYSSYASELEDLGATVYVGHSADQISGADYVIRSSAIPEDNVEIQAAIDAQIPVYKRSEFLGKLTAEHMCVAVAGTHGKTTTTAMISWMLTALDQDPSYIIGGISKNLANNAHAGNGPAFVIEADEYDYMFLGLRPHIAVVTNIEHDHPDCFPTPDDFYQSLCKEYLLKRAKICSVLKKIGLVPFIPQGAYYVLANANSLPGKTSKEKAMYLLRKTGVASVPGSAFYHDNSGKNLLRFCFAKKERELNNACEKLLRL